MGLFSLFKKGKPDAADEGDEAAARLAADSEAQRMSAQTQLQRDIARATAMKIDAIEAAMEADIFNEPEPAWGSRPQRPPRPPAPAAGDDNPDTLPLLDAHTTQLLADDEMPAPVAAEETAPVVEESAILYANGQGAVAGQMLRAALAEAAGQGAAQDRTPWWLLFDLYQADGQRDAFDSLSIDYASTFETSPPPWRGPAHGPPADAADGAAGGVAPTHVFGHALDAGVAAQLERLRAQSVPLLRLDFSHIATVDAAGCALLLETLRALQARQQDLIVVAAAELAELLRSCVCVGRRDDGEAIWLLLLETLQLLNREKDFEETSMDYCVTFEVSPPAFQAPRKVETAARQPVAAPSERYMLPPVIGGDIGGLLAAIGAYAEQYPALVFDCSRLARLEFGAGNQLLAQLQTLAADGRRVEFREVNHLVAALMRLLGYAGLGRVFAHKY
ncbi:hypothetical protein [Pseudoduganella namucuonensis]|uniref:STAS domain-containing protein n=1 Tax=Pseudoduganella namucuonensis TaxID=1035707 RepID=A0A1I7LKQ0_9BURK|nr:hypothetical protein [Pseudoduganella namucuonensis]SFV10200.1 hypothetical protein SAMN05216552_103147 [Pseudoduganella namucuonensis]